MGVRVVDLFCGAGGFSLGMRRAGFDVVAGYDYKAAALAVHAANVRPQKLPLRLPTYGRHRHADLSDLLAHAPTIADMAPAVVVGGPPCVAFSRANPGRGDHNPEASLLDAFATVVMVSRPRYFAMENVVDAQKSVFWERAMRLLARAGYGLSSYEMDMSWYGVGQARERVFLMGALGEAPGWANAYFDAARQPQRTTVRDVLGKKCDDLYFRLGFRDGDDPTKGRRSFRSTDEPGATLTSTYDRKATCKEGYVVRDADIDFFRKSGLYFMYRGGSSSAGTLRLDDPSPTLTRNSCYGAIPSYIVKKGDVLPVEALPTLPLDALAALAGYPADYNWHPGRKPTNKGDLMTMFANSVPPPISELVGRTIMQHSRGEQPKVTVALPDGFEAWLAGPGGIAPANVRQRATEAIAALRLLGSRVFAFEGDAVRHLETMPMFRALPPTRRSNVLAGLRLLDRYRARQELVERRLTLADCADFADEGEPFPSGFSLRRRASAPALDSHDDGGEVVLREPLPEPIPA